MSRTPSILRTKFHIRNNKSDKISYFSPICVYIPLTPHISNIPNKYAVGRISVPSPSSLFVNPFVFFRSQTHTTLVYSIISVVVPQFSASSHVQTDTIMSFCFMSSIQRLDSTSSIKTPLKKYTKIEHPLHIQGIHQFAHKKPIL